MRIVAGTWKGRVIDAPPGRDTRPTTERTRESIASTLLSLFDLSFEGVRVLDAFAGSGAFGIEMLSRGAESCVFIDADRRAIQVIKKNLASLHASTRSYRVICSDARKSVKTLAVKDCRFDLIFLDPPYIMSEVAVSQLVQMLIDEHCVTMGCIVAYERATSAPSLDVARLELVRTKKLGETSIDYFQIGDEHD